MDDERYELHARLQTAMFNANAAFRDLSIHHIAHSTFHTFIHKPELAKDKTLGAVRLTCEFLEAACESRLLPLPREQLKDKNEIIRRLYQKWWDNNRHFPIGTKVEV
jgi:hypothetical protein